MGLLDKHSGPIYSPVPSERSADSSDGLLYDGDVHSNSPETRRSRKKTVLIALGGFFVFVAYSVLLVTATSMWWKKERLHGANVIDSPIRKYIQYEPKIFEMTETSKDYPLVGQPSDELDARWSNLMQYFYAQVPASYMKKLGREKTGIRLKNGNYLANFAWVHQLHCIKRLHQAHFPERYYPNMTDFEKELQTEHSLHCLQMLVEAIMCKADETPLTMIWFDNSILPGGNRTIAHECVNWDRLLRGMDEIKVDPFEPGVLVHPKFGPVVPDGRYTKLDNRIGYIFNPVPLDRDKYP
ncbi:2718d2ac-2974-4226-8370-f84f2e3dcb32 [Thermothielavioides terrestris]|nr:2718d2ac-2974-4226-8370-f84f2e3dcb32 [Thermothielavioides terrestris]